MSQKHFIQSYQSQSYQLLINNLIVLKNTILYILNITKIMDLNQL